MREPGPGARPQRSQQAKFWLGTAAAAAAAVLIADLLIGTAHRGSPNPHPSQSPGDVVRIQLGALSKDSGLDFDAGVEIAYRFASPSNRAQTGPLSHFRMIVRAPAYRAMIGHIAAELGTLAEDGRIAMQEVSVLANDGRSSRYLFQLTRQSRGPLAGCWLTDAVYPLDDSGESDRSAAVGVEI